MREILCNIEGLNFFHHYIQIWAIITYASARKYEDIFDSTLGTWNTNLVYLELRDYAKPVCSQPYPVPRVHEAMFRKEVERLVNLGVLEEANNSEWRAP